MNADQTDRLEQVIAMAARKAAKNAKGRYEVDELVSEAWVYAHDPVRTKTVEHHLDNAFQEGNHKMTVGENRLLRLVGRHLDDWTREQSGLAPRDAKPNEYGRGRQTVEINAGPTNSRRLSSDSDPDEWAEYTLEQAFPYSDRRFKQGYSIEHVDWTPPKPQPLGGRYGTAQVFPFHILDYARLEGLISAFQAELLKRLMDGDSATDLACRFPEEAKGSIQSSVSQALRALRREPQVQAWARSLGFDVLAIKGESWTSEHRHDDGRPEGPAPARPFTCDCSRGEASYDEHALDKSDPFLKLVA